MAKSTLRFGSRGRQVVELQRYMNQLNPLTDLPQNQYLVMDGIFGRNTSRAVRTYQDKNGLSVDGVVGRNTWAAIEEASADAAAPLPPSPPPIRSTPNAARRAALLTCVSNNGQYGPGHSAVIVDNFAHNFQGVLGRVRTSLSAWVSFANPKYLRQNVHRPVVIQELTPGIVNATAIANYIHASMARDDDYIGSGVCSQQAILAISAGCPGDINPLGVWVQYTMEHLRRLTAHRLRAKVVSHLRRTAPQPVRFGSTRQ